MKELRDPFACDDDQRFDTTVKCPTWRASFWNKRDSPLYEAKHQSNARKGVGGAWAGLELTGTETTQKLMQTRLEKISFFI